MWILFAYSLTIFLTNEILCSGISRHLKLHHKIFISIAASVIVLILSKDITFTEGIKLIRIPALFYLLIIFNNNYKLFAALLQYLVQKISNKTIHNNYRTNIKYPEIY